MPDSLLTFVLTGRDSFDFLIFKLDFFHRVYIIVAW
jgi:hypothetical protein